VASFGALGYELNLSYVTSAEKKEIKEQIKLYKGYRGVLQYGTFKRFDVEDSNRKVWQVSRGDTHFVGNFQYLQPSSPNLETLYVKDLKPEALYRIRSVNQRMPIDRFGHLISHALPIKVHPSGFLMRTLGKYKQLDNATEDYVTSGQVLMNGLKLKQQFMGTWYNDQTRIMGDFGSQLYIIEKKA
jgi:alpha-galactosidase